LQKLLRGIAELQFEHVQPEVRVVIVENEADGPGRAVCERLKPEFPFPLEHHVEPRRGIPFARNTAIERAGEVDFIAFIDDDEIPDANWLDELLRVQAKHNTDMVAGPVLPLLERTIPGWMVRGAFWNRKRYSTGTPVLPLGTGNVLIRRSSLSDIGEPFDDRLALTGSSDTHLFKRLGLAGCTSVWADDALVHETVPASRCSVHWVCARAYRTGTGFAAITCDLGEYRRPRLYVAYVGLKHLVRGGLGIVPGLILGRHVLVAQLLIIYRGLGMFAWLFGHQYQEYKTIHGR
jgi:GT2 family glycosyltransferase